MQTQSDPSGGENDNHKVGIKRVHFVKCPIIQYV